MSEVVIENVMLTVSAYKEARGITDAKRDIQIKEAIPRAEQTIVDYTGRRLNIAPTLETRSYRYDGGTVIDIDDCEVITNVTLNERPLSENIEFVGGARRGEPVFSWLEVVPDLWQIDPLFEVTHVVHDRTFRGFQQLKVTATFGWPAAQLPSTVEQAAIWLVDEFVTTDAESTGIAAESIVDLSYVYRGEEQPQLVPTLPPRVAQILQRLVRVEV